MRIDSLRDWVCPSITEIATILAACPNLETLKLSHMAIQQDDPAPLDPIHLPQLKYLNLRGLKPRPLDMLLGLIVPGSRDVSLSISLKRVHFISDELLHFFCRMRVTTLFAYWLKQPEWLCQIMTTLPYLENLAVHSGMLTKSMIPQHSVIGQAPGALHHTQRICNFYLLSCQTDLDTIFELCMTGVAQKILLLHVVSPVSCHAIMHINLSCVESGRSASDGVSHVFILGPGRSYPYLGWPCLD